MRTPTWLLLPHQIPVSHHQEELSSTLSPSLHLEDLERTRKHQQPQKSLECSNDLGPFCLERIEHHKTTEACGDPVVEAAKAEFRKLDVNGDGLLSPAEMAVRNEGHKEQTPVAELLVRRRWDMFG